MVGISRSGVGTAVADKASVLIRAVTILLCLTATALAEAPATNKPRTIQLTGQLSDTIEHPTDIEISGGQETVTAWTDRKGRYQARISVEPGASGELELFAELRESDKYPKDPTCMGWFDKLGRASYTETTRDLAVDWSPTPDCCSN